MALLNLALFPWTRNQFLSLYGLKSHDVLMVPSFLMLQAEPNHPSSQVQTLRAVQAPFSQPWKQTTVCVGGGGGGGGICVCVGGGVCVYMWGGVYVCVGGCMCVCGVCVCVCVHTYIHNLIPKPCMPRFYLAAVEKKKNQAGISRGGS